MNDNVVPAVSIIMSIYKQDNEEQLHKAIESVLAQKFKDFEFILYNDGSKKNIAECLHEYAKKDKRIRVMHSDENHGLAYSLNSCILAAKGKYLARMDDDDICTPDRLQIQYEYLENNPDISLVGCNAFLLDENGIWGKRKMVEKPAKKDFLKFSPFIHPTVMIRRNIFENQEGYCTSKNTWRCEDYELFMRLYQEGYRGYNIQKELLYYREDRRSYKKRKFCYRLDEFRLRYRNFRQLGIMFPFGWLYVVRPLVAAIVPSRLILGLKKYYHRQGEGYGQVCRNQAMGIPENLEKSPNMVQGI